MQGLLVFISQKYCLHSFTPSLLHSLILMQRYYRIFWQSEIMQSSAKFCKVRRFSPLIMSKKKVFPFISGTRCQNQRNPSTYTNAARCACKRNSLPTRKERRLRRREVYLPKGVRNVSEAFRDTRIIRVRYARRRVSCTEIGLHF